MDLFRSKKRGSESASMGEMSETLQKRHRNLSGSVDDLLESADDSQDEVFTDELTTDSEPEDVQKASKMQKIFAKKLIKRDKRKEKEHRKKVEKNLISMDDFLRKQSEFKMWLYEEKSKNAGTLSSPKLKSYFKQFVRSWNKHKLQPKYYKSSTLPESPRTPLASKDLNFMSDEGSHVAGPLESESNGAEVKKEPTSPFVTFGKTPPKVFRSKKLQLFGSSPDVALISVAPLDQGPSVNDVAGNKDKSSKGETCEYRVPSIKSHKTSTSKQDTPSPQFIGATPYKVSVFSWAVGETSDCDQDQSLNLCSTETPPNLSHAGQDDQEHWPPPPSESELNCQSTSDSPHVPPPPPPRKESLPRSVYNSGSVMSSRSDYSDPYDKLPEQSTSRDGGHYQDPVDCVVGGHSENNAAFQQKPRNCSLNQAAVTRFSLKSDDDTVQTDSKLVMKGLMSSCDEPDSSMYSKPVIEKRLSRDELEEMYAKPVKKLRKCSGDGLIDGMPSKVDTGATGGLYAEIMAHFEQKKLGSDSKSEKQEKINDPHYESIEDVFGKDEINSERMSEDSSAASKKDKNGTDTVDKSTSVINEMKKLPEFSGLAKNKKKTVLAASSDKIYETYLSLGHKLNPFKSKQTGNKSEPVGFSYGALRKRHKSQPDISVSDNIQLYENIEFQTEFHGKFKPDKLFFGSSKDADYSNNKVSDTLVTSCPKLSEQQRAASCENNLCMLDSPRTPTIMATPSFESLCKVTPLSVRSQSSQSLPVQSGSSDNLSGSDSFMSTSTNSSLSSGLNDQSGSVHSLQSDKSLSPVPEESETITQHEAKKTTQYRAKQTNEHEAKQTNNHETNRTKQPKTKQHEEKSSVDPVKPAVPSMGSLTPGKANVAKLGIDLSVYLLKPTQHDENSNNNIKHEEGQSTNSKLKAKEIQSKLAIKDTLSGLKTKVETPTTGIRKDTERRHTVQTIQEMREGYIIQKKPDHPAHVPNIGVNGKVRKLESNFTTSNKDVDGIKEGCEPEFKRHCADRGKSGRSKDNYLETDIDTVAEDKPKPRLRKSKSHSGFPTGSTSNVVTEIW